MIAIAWPHGSVHSKFSLHEIRAIPSITSLHVKEYPVNVSIPQTDRLVIKVAHQSSFQRITAACFHGIAYQLLTYSFFHTRYPFSLLNYKEKTIYKLHYMIRTKYCSSRESCLGYRVLSSLKRYRFKFILNGSSEDNTLFNSIGILFQAFRPE